MLFERLLALQGKDRADEIERLRGAEPALYPRLCTLLRADGEAASAGFLGLGSTGPTPGLDDEPALQPGQLLGAYRLERALGSGGMGEVWLARRADGLFETPVALKLLHRHLVQSSVRERFIREGRILGELSHANVARLLDAGALASGQLYLAIEYVEGERIDLWCDQHRLDIRARLRLFLQVCDAVVHAHAHLVVHRDLKPTNILVSADGHVKLLDFGIAKLVLDEAGEAHQTELTRLGGRALTPEFAAPEQVLGMAITTATDVYALGVILYQLLSGCRPYGVAGVTASQAERQVLEIEPPPPSQARVAGETPEQARSRAALRSATPGQLRASLRGDLDTIVATALKKSPAQRYPSVPALAADLQAHLRDEPIRAVPDSLGYRLGKYLRRNRLALGVAATILVALTAGLSVALWQARAARLASAEASTRRAQADQLINFMLGDLPDKLKPLGRLDLLDAVIDQVQSYFQHAASLAEAPSPAQISQAAALKQLAYIRQLQGRLPEALQQFDAALAQGEQVLARYPQEPAVLQEMFSINSFAGIAAQSAGESDLARRRFEQCRSLLQKLLAIDPDHPDWQGQLGRVEDNLGFIDFQQTDFAAALKHFHAAADIERALIARGVDLPTHRLGLARALRFIAHCQRALGRYVEAKAASSAALAIGRSLVAADPDNFDILIWQLRMLVADAGIDGETGRLDAAQAQLREARAIGERLIQRDGSNVEWRYEYAVALAGAADIEALLGHAGLVRRLLDSALTNFRAVYRADPSRPRWRRGYADALVRSAQQGWVVDRDPVQALRSIDQSLALWGADKGSSVERLSRCAAQLMVAQLGAELDSARSAPALRSALEQIEPLSAVYHDVGIRLLQLQLRYLQGDISGGDDLYLALRQQGYTSEPMQRMRSAACERIVNAQRAACPAL
ncbi:serine/threonine-protein kinase [Hydrocarboniphaga sp.]|uniref:serine/threonine-protein kinase n=1 Tax=Hydrocarboniphaga sp. TaxID=2033016 RepID=UPI00262B3BFB|nr:serine/threonine-protein kinase [Hydrocarboniphaga sp.]